VTETNVEAEAESSDRGTAAGDEANHNQENQRCQATSMMSRISGVRRGRTTSSSNIDVQKPSSFGVDGVPDSILIEVWASAILMLADYICVSCREFISVFTLSTHLSDVTNNQRHYCI